MGVWSVVLTVAFSSCSGREMRERALRSALDAVVSITAASGAASGSVVGSGFIVGDDCRIVTAYHLVASGRPTLIEFADGTRARTVMLGMDEGADLAVVRPENPAPCRGRMLKLRSEPSRIGETAIAIGAPFGLRGSVTKGIISAVDRYDPQLSNGPRRYSYGLVQTDAAANPGNSGGPLVDTDGQAMGMIVGILPAADRIGFALPASTIGTLMKRLAGPKG